MVPVAAFLLGLLGWLLVLGAIRRRGGAPCEPRWGATHGSPREWGLCAVGVVAANLPVLQLVVPMASSDFPLFGDLASHAVVAQAIGRHGLPHGWVDTVNGGFPFGIHYPPLGTFLAVGLGGLGLSARHAVLLLAVASLLAAPLLGLCAARAAGARPPSALVGALALSWVAPFSAFVGGWESVLLRGLLSQSIACALAIGWLWALLGRGPAICAPLLAALLVTAHPQVALALFALVLVPIVAAPAPDLARRYARSALAATATAVAVFGPGVATLGVPFGWPPMPSWKRIGFSPAELEPWFLRGEMLDRDRLPIMTAALAAALATLLARVRQRSCRALLSAALGWLGLVLSGAALAELGRAGSAVLAFLQPLRVLSLGPLVLAAVLVVAAEQIAAVGSWLLRPGAPSTARAARSGMLAQGIGALLLIPVTAAAFAPRVRWLDQWVLGRAAFPDGSECGRGTPVGYRTDAVAGWLQQLAQGRFAFDGHTSMGNCPATRGLELSSPVPLGGTYGYGAHVGLLALAFDRVRPLVPGSAARAEALGIRAWLHTADRRPTGPEWRRAATAGDVELSIRRGGTDLVGAGCIVARWRGSNEALHAALLQDLQGDAQVLADPTRLVALEPSGGPLCRREAVADDCRADGVEVDERPREPGAYEALVSAPTPVDVVLRATAHPRWVVRVDGVVAATELVAPGFMAVRVPTGRHLVQAEVAVSWAYWLGLALAAAVVGAAGLGGRGRGFRCRRARPERGAEA